MSKYGILDVTLPSTNVELYDCLIQINKKDYFVNLKTSLTLTKERGRFDVSKAVKLLKWYESNPDLILLVAIVKVELDKVTVHFRDVIIFNVAWTPDIYYNRANHNLQTSADGRQIPRSNHNFVSLLRQKIEEKGHTSHY